ncbi:hypothetical protein KSX_73650 [Ktedonospora formicarum]|uniref:Uncharacterized protein n=1 Tax=Ktedonospora formicarum TaxID=2778364 RepID=A0A8J3I318_9CHLR|nr:hypothetical protein KSX_73650 [Ktedonospora formicarum]
MKLLVEELTDKIDAANQRNDATGWASILLYGETLANKQGFILLRWERAKASEIFRNIIKRFLDDHDIVDHLCLPMTIFDLGSEHIE